MTNEKNAHFVERARNWNEYEHGPLSCPKCEGLVEKRDEDEYYCPRCGWHSDNPDDEKEESLEETFGMDENIVKTNIYHN